MIPSPDDRELLMMAVVTAAIIFLGFWAAGAFA